MNPIVGSVSLEFISTYLPSENEIDGCFLALNYRRDEWRIIGIHLTPYSTLGEPAVVISYIVSISITPILKAPR